jgi:N-carbamoyl-L-amino-acid hydrolase
MLFVPSIGGISQHWTEDTNDEQSCSAARSMATAAARILGS